MVDDDEGTQMKRNVLIKDGMLVKSMADILSARQIKMERTGNGRRVSFRNIPIVRMSNTFIDTGEDKPSDILSSTPSGRAPQGEGDRTWRTPEASWGW